MPTLVVVSCGKRKVWNDRPSAGPTRARDAYTGIPYKTYREYAERFSDKWVILSAKHGFLEPDSIIPEDYNVTFEDPLTNPISTLELAKQVRQNDLDKYDLVIVLGGRSYTNAVSQAFSGSRVLIKKPLEGLRLGYSVQAVKNAIRQNRLLEH